MALVWWCGEAADQSWAAWGGVQCIMEAGPVEATQELGAGTSVPELSPTPRPGETWPCTVSTLYITLHPYTATLSDGPNCLDNHLIQT